MFTTFVTNIFNLTNKINGKKQVDIYYTSNALNEYEAQSIGLSLSHCKNEKDNEFVLYRTTLTQGSNHISSSMSLSSAQHQRMCCVPSEQIKDNL